MELVLGGQCPACRTAAALDSSAWADRAQPFCPRDGVPLLLRRVYREAARVTGNVLLTDRDRHGVTVWQVARCELHGRELATRMGARWPMSHEHSARTVTRHGSTDIQVLPPGSPGCVPVCVNCLPDLPAR